MAQLGDGAKAILDKRSHRLVRCWKVTPARVSTNVAAVIRVTDHNKTIVVGGQEYTPQGGLSASAFSKQAELGSGSNVELRGAMRTDRFSESHLEAGLWIGATVYTFVVDWRFPFAKIRETTLRIQSTELDGDSWKAQAVQLGSLLRSKVGLILNRDCSWQLGDADCKVDLAAITDSATVSAVNIGRLDFTTSLDTHVDDYYQFGKLTWTSGDNEGSVHNVKLSRQASNRIVLFLETALTVRVGDSFNLHPGCGKVPEYCKGTDGDKDRPWANNIDNHGGNPTISGSDQQIRPPG